MIDLKCPKNGGPGGNRTHLNILLAREATTTCSPQAQKNARLRNSIGRAICLLTPQYRILPYLNGNHTFTTPMVAMATPRNYDIPTSSVTDWRSTSELRSHSGRGAEAFLSTNLKQIHLTVLFDHPASAPAVRN